ncbi:MAG: pyridoxamine 5'-phosphate oxidase family protein [Steroidobacteraceae bacterium]
MRRDPVIHDEHQTGDMANVAELIWSIRIALLTTADPEGHFHTRPVETLQIERGADIWFFTGWSSPKVDELLRDRRVSLGYADPGRRVYLAVGGWAGLLRDPTKARELWTEEQRAYYPNGPGDERLALLRVRIERAEYWIAPRRATYRIAAATAAATGKPADVVGENHRIR